MKILDLYAIGSPDLLLRGSYAYPKHIIIIDCNSLPPVLNYVSPAFSLPVP